MPVKGSPGDPLSGVRCSGLPHEAVAPWLAEGGLERLEAFFERRRIWAGTHNLSGPRALDDPWGPDLVDGVAVALASPPDRALVDVGAGSGVPGLVVACLQPTRPVVLVEPIAKRTAFLRSVAARLGLSAVRVQRGRWPIDLGLGEPVDVVSRAVVDPGDWPALATSGGVQVCAVLRMLAARRPPWGVPGFALSGALDYDLGTHGPRRIERWVREDDGR